jgi:UrcA family protein
VAAFIRRSRYLGQSAISSAQPKDDIMKRLPILLATLLTGMSAAQNSDATPSLAREPHQRVVSFADLDLDNSADARTLVRRIKYAARQVCYAEGLLAVMQAARMHQCVRQATARAMASVKLGGTQ